jgi:hypothetical protein
LIDRCLWSTITSLMNAVFDESTKRKWQTFFFQQKTWMYYYPKNTSVSYESINSVIRFYWTRTNRNNCNCLIFVLKKDFIVIWWIHMLLSTMPSIFFISIGYVQGITGGIIIMTSTISTANILRTEWKKNTSIFFVFVVFFSSSFRVYLNSIISNVCWQQFR